LPPPGPVHGLQVRTHKFAQEWNKSLLQALTMNIVHT
jgi:hypothetical protein